MNHNDPPVARCAGRSWLFESLDKADHAVARKECLGDTVRGPCPAIDACRATLRDLQLSQWNSGIHGTWAGHHYGYRAKLKESA